MALTDSAEEARKNFEELQKLHRAQIHHDAALPPRLETRREMAARQWPGQLYKVDFHHGEQSPNGVVDPNQDLHCCRQIQVR